jgi:hypothetical protein
MGAFMIVIILLPGWAILVRVRGYGRYVTGTYQGGVPGWRAERVVIDRLHIPPDVPAEIVAALARRYQCDVRRDPRLPLAGGAAPA